MANNTNNWKWEKVKTSADGKITTYTYPDGVETKAVMARLDKLYKYDPSIEYQGWTESRVVCVVRRNPEEWDECDGCGDDMARCDCYECGECGTRTPEDDLDDWQVGKDYTETLCPDCQ